MLPEHGAGKFQIRRTESSYEREACMKTERPAQARNSAMKYSNMHKDKINLEAVKKSCSTARQLVEPALRSTMNANNMWRL
jgi:hypothetical protein